MGGMSDRLVAGRYRLVSRLGAGAMAQVWRAFDETLRREVAVKLVDLSAAPDAATAERFQREAVAVAQLNHRNIVTVFDTGREGSTAYLVMELVGGRSLAQVIREDGPLTIPDAARLGGQVALAVEAAHAIGIVHRDIKPANIMVDGERVILLDFGIARLADDAAHLTATATTIGTAAYMSPEQAQGLVAGPASDVYSLGCVLVTALTGTPPFPGDNAIQVASRQISDPAPSVRGRRPEVPFALDALVADMMAKAPRSRPSTADVRAALAGVASAPGPAATAVLPAGASEATAPLGTPPLTVPLGTPTLTAPLGTPSPRPVREDLVVTPPPDDRRFKRVALGLGLLIAALLVVGIGWVLGSNLVASLQPRTSSPPTPAAAPRPSTPAVRKPTPAVSAPAPVAWPSVPLPSLPSALDAATSAVGVGIDAIKADSKDAQKTKAQLQSAWASASKQIVAGRNPTKAIEGFQEKLDDARDSMSPLEYLTISAALKAVSAAL